MKEIHILNLGAGVQSTTLYLIFMHGNDPAGFQRAIEIDAALRIPGHVVNRNLDQQLYVHRSCVPLSEAPLEKRESLQDQTFMGFYQECHGLCGN
jgi:hypothetical protein